MKIKTVVKTRNVKLKYPNREQRAQGITSRVEQFTNVSITDLEPNQKVLVLGEWEINQLIESLGVSMATLAAFDKSAYALNTLGNIKTKLEKAVAPVEATEVTA